MKPSSKKALAWVIGVAGFILVVGIMNANKEESPWKPGEPWEKAVRQMEKRARENPPPPPAAPRPLDPIEDMAYEVRKLRQAVERRNMGLRW